MGWGWRPGDGCTVQGEEDDPKLMHEKCDIWKAVIQLMELQCFMVSCTGIGADDSDTSNKDHQ